MKHLLYTIDKPFFIIQTLFCTSQRSWCHSFPNSLPFSTCLDLGFSYDSRELFRKSFFGRNLTLTDHLSLRRVTRNVRRRGGDGNMNFRYQQTHVMLSSDTPLLFSHPLHIKQQTSGVITVLVGGGKKTLTCSENQWKSKPTQSSEYRRTMTVH